MVFGVHSESTSPARLRIEQAGRAFQIRFAREVLARRIEERRRRIIERVQLALASSPRGNAQLLTERVCARRGVSPALIVSDIRTRKVIEARHEIWWLCRTRLHMTYTAMATMFRRDHTTIMHGVAGHARRMAARP